MDFKFHFDFDSINQSEDCCYFETKKSNRLLITIGESWTWGDSLEEHGHQRLECIWGRHVSNSLKSDWLNVARKGASNLWIFFQLQELARYIDSNGPLPYDQKDVVACCTEWGREYNENWEWFEDFDLQLQEPIKQNAVLVEYAKFWIDKIGANLLITHNFCDPLFWKHDMPQLNKNWIEITCEKLDQEYSYQIPTTANYPHLKDTGMDLSEIIEYQNRSLSLVNFLDESPYNYSEASKHPTPESHKFWAEYISDNLN